MLTIAHCHNDYHLPQGTPNVAHLQRRLDRITAEKLPVLIATMFSHAPTDQRAIYRIRHLHLTLWLDVLNFRESDLADRWARLLMQGLVRSLLYGSRENVIRYEDEAHYLATFFIDLMAGQAWTSWQYAEFAPYQHAPPGRVIASLLGSEPNLLLPIAQRLHRGGKLAPLVAQMQQQDIELLWQRGLGFAAAAPQTLPPEVLQPLLSDFAPDLPLDATQTFVHTRLHLYIALCLTHPDWTGRQETAAAAHQLALIHAHYLARPAPWLWQALARQEVDSPAALAPLIATLDAQTAAYATWLVEQLASATGRAALAQLVAAVVPPTTLTDTVDSKETALFSQQTRIAFAGLALLLPIVRAWEWDAQMGRYGLYQLLIDLIEPKLRPLAWSDVGVQWLCGLTADETQTARRAKIPWPAVLDETFDPAAPYLPTSQALLRHFASTLHGFANSSPAYLQKQFFQLPGKLTLTETAVDVQFSRAPLGILLEMAGYSGEQGSLPWLDGRELVIHLPN